MLVNRWSIARGMFVGALAVLCLAFHAGAAIAPPTTIPVNCAAPDTITNHLTGPTQGPVTVVLTGTCVEALTINQDDVTIQSVGLSPATGGVQALPGGVANAAIIVNGQRILVDSITIDANGSFWGIQSNGASRLRVQNSTVINAASHGVYLFEGNRAILQNLVVQNNQGSGIAVAGGVALIFGGSTNITGNTQNGIWLSEGGAARIGMNAQPVYTPGMAIQNNGAAGIAVTSGGSALVGGVNIHNNGTIGTSPSLDGVFVDHGTASLVGTNNVHANGGSGVRALTGTLLIGDPNFGALGLATTNTISSNTGDGITVDKASAMVFGVTGTTVTSNTGFGVRCGLDSTSYGDTSAVTGNTAGQVDPNC